MKLLLCNTVALLLLWVTSLAFAAGSQICHYKATGVWCVDILRETRNQRFVEVYKWKDAQFELQFIATFFCRENSILTQNGSSLRAVKDPMLALFNAACGTLA